MHIHLLEFNYYFREFILMAMCACLWEREREKSYNCCFIPQNGCNNHHWARLKQGVSHRRAKYLGHLLQFGQVHEHPGFKLKLVPTWAVGTGGSSLTYWTTIPAPLLLLLLMHKTFRYSKAPVIMPKYTKGFPQAWDFHLCIVNLSLDHCLALGDIH